MVNIEDSNTEIPPQADGPEVDKLVQAAEAAARAKAGDIAVANQGVDAAAREMAYNDALADTLSDYMLKARSENFQKAFDWLSEENQRKWLRADDQNIVFTAIEKFLPTTYIYLIEGIPQHMLKELLGFCVNWGILDVQDEIREDMRELGKDWMNIPPKYIALILTAVGLAEAVPYVMAVLKLAKANEVLRDKVREKTLEKATAAKQVEATQEEEHEKAADATPEDVVAHHQKAA